MGNVPQLALDLIANSLALAHVCNVDSDALLPLCGHSDASGTLCAPGELFRSTKEPTTAALQLRVPPTPARARAWCRSLASWAVNRVGATRVVLLTTVPSTRALQEQPVPRLLANEAWGPLAAAAAAPESAPAAPWAPLEGAIKQDALAEASVLAQLYGELCGRSVPTLVVALCCAEGDNVPDAVALASWCAQFFGLTALAKEQQGEFKWQAPPSWGTTTFWGGEIGDFTAEFL